MVSFGPGNFSAFRYYFASLNSQEAMTYEKAVSKWTQGKFVQDSDT